jgi:uncharacterized DUF497 family protein
VDTGRDRSVDTDRDRPGDNGGDGLRPDGVCYARAMPLNYPVRLPGARRARILSRVTVGVGMLAEFEWDPRKASTNLAKHGVSFDEATTVFRDGGVVSVVDETHSDREERWYSIGLSASGRLLVVCHTFVRESERAVRIRIFSCRKATSREFAQYEG